MKPLRIFSLLGFTGKPIRDLRFQSHIVAFVFGGANLGGRRNEFSA